MSHRIIPIILLGLLILPVIATPSLSINAVSNNDSASNNFINVLEWNVQEYVNVTLPPIISDLFLNNTNYLLLVSNTTLYTVKVAGNQIEDIWTFTDPLNSTIIASPVTADFDGDAALEIAVLDSNGTVYFLDAKNGNVIKSVSTNEQPLNTSSNLVVFDLDGDGYLDAIFLTKDKVVLTSLGPHEYRVFTPSEIYPQITSGPIITDFDFDENRVHHVVFTSGSKLIAFNPATGTQYVELLSDILLFGGIGNYTEDINYVSKYEFAIITVDNNISFVAFTEISPLSIRYTIRIDQINNSLVPPVTADFDADNFDEVLVAHINGSIYIIGSSGIEKTFNIASNVTSCPIITDLDADNYPDAVLTLTNGSVVVVDFDSVQKLADNLEDPKWPLIGDINNDGASELIVTVRGGIAIYSIGAVVDSWMIYLHDIRRTNYPYTPKDSDGDGLPDPDETYYNTSAISSDSDDDKIIDFTEIFVVHTDPNDNDTDDDNLPDGWEYMYGFNATSNDTNGDGTLDPYEDNDGDNITNINEFRNGTSPLTNDTDEDGLGDLDELINGTDPTNPDTDNDGMADGWEIKYGFDPKNSTDGALDSDEDGLLNKYEYLNGTDPHNPDTDDDGMPDGWEVQYGLNPTNGIDGYEDADNDGLENALEYKIGSNPTNNDTDKDGLPDGWEYTYALNPLDPRDNSSDFDGDGLSNAEEYNYDTNPRSPDTDADGMPDNWEIKYGFDPKVKDDYLDADSDGLTNGLEYVYNTDPLNPDTDGDGLIDSVEVLVHGTDPLKNDTDGDGLTDFAEIVLGTNPRSPDTDGDGISDYDELLRGTDPLDPTNGVAITAFLASLSLIALGLLVSLVFPWLTRKKEEEKS